MSVKLMDQEVKQNAYMLWRENERQTSLSTLGVFSISAGLGKSRCNNYGPYIQAFCRGPNNGCVLGDKQNGTQCL